MILKILQETKDLEAAIESLDDGTEAKKDFVNNWRCVTEAIFASLKRPLTDEDVDGIIEDIEVMQRRVELARTFNGTLVEFNLKHA